MNQVAVTLTTTKYEVLLTAANVPPTWLNVTGPALAGPPGPPGPTITAGPGFQIVGTELRHAFSTLPQG